MTAFLFLRGLPWRIILPVLGALALLWAAYDWAYDRGVAHERAGWEAEAVRLREVAAQEAAERQAAVDSANRDDAARINEMTRAMTRLQQKVTTYAQSQNGLSCGLDADGGLLINEAVAAANAAASARSRPR